MFWRLTAFMISCDLSKKGNVKLKVDFENCVYASFDQSKMKFPFQGIF